ncbi:RNA-directed DNA polymerase [Tanacetum coccineum]
MGSQNGNPFAAKRGENHTILHLSKEEENNDLPYPKFRNFKQVAAQIIKKHEEHAFPSTSQEESTQSYQPPHDSIMGPSVYPPAQQNPQPFYRPDYQFGYPRGKGKTFSGGYGEYYNSQWTLPPAWTESGVMLVLPADPGLWSEVISRWESITINRLNNQTWSDNKAKLAFVENLLGESEKLMWQQWRTAYPGAYSALEAIADEPQNITSQVRQLILLEDPYRGSTDEQHIAYRDLDLRTKYPGLNSGVLPAIKFTHTFVSEMCKDAALAKELRDLSLCSAIPIPGHFAKDCRSKQRNIARSVVYQELDLDDNWDIVSADFDDSSVYSIGDTHQSISVTVQDTPIEETVFMAIEDDNESDNEQVEEDNQSSHYTFMFHPGPPTKIAEMVQSVGSWKPNKELQSKVKNLRIEKERLEEQKDEEIRELKAQPCIETEVHYSGNATTSLKIRKITNQLYNVKVEFDIPNCTAFGTTAIIDAIIDTGASACCINKKVIPKEALEPLTHIVFFNGLNSRQQATHRIKQGYFLIEENKFKIPLIYAFDMRDSNGIEMLIGANFLRSMKGGIRIEEDEITIYKNVTKIKTSNQTQIAEIAELEVSEEEFLEINDPFISTKKEAGHSKNNSNLSLIG